VDVVDVVIDKDVVVDVDKLDNDVVYVVDVIVDVLVVFDVDKEDVESDVIFEEICFINFILKLSKPMYVDGPLIGVGIYFFIFLYIFKYRGK